MFLMYVLRQRGNKGKVFISEDLLHYEEIGLIDLKENEECLKKNIISMLLNSY